MGKRFLTTEVIPQRPAAHVRSRFTRDQLITADPQPFNPRLLGRAWVGSLRAQLDAMSTSDRRATLDEMFEALDDYAQGAGGLSHGSMNVGANGALVTGRPEKEFVLDGTATPESIMQANDRFWKDRMSPVSATRYPLRANARAQTCEEIYEANKRFYG